MQNRCLNVIGLPRDTVASPVTRRQNLTRKELKRILESEAHPCKRFFDKPVEHGHNLRQGPRSKFSSGGAKEECVKENFFRAGGGGMLVDFYSISLK